MDPVTLALIGGGISAASSALGGLFGKSKESKSDKRKRHLIDDLLASVQGKGPYSEMFNTSEAAFNKSYVEPAKARFRNEIAPQIQQSYIYSGQQGNTGLQDTLTRAGVDLDQLLNEQYLNYQNQGNANKQNVFNAVLGANPSTQNQSYGNAAMQGLGGYLSGENFGEDIGDILKSFQRGKQNQLNDVFKAPRSGFVDDQVYNPYTGVQQ